MYLFRMGIVFVLGSSIALGQRSNEESKVGSKVQNSNDTALTRILKSEAEGYRIQLKDSAKTKLKLEPTPLLRWVNPVRNRQMGLVYVWTENGRARAIGSVFNNFVSDIRMYTIHEFHSLASSGLVATNKESGDVWHPAKPGVEWKPLPDAPPPGKSRTRRLLQMKRLGREFRGHSIDAAKSRYELRLLPKPLFRYQTPKDDIYDGAVFSMVSTAGTDPEILLTFEVKKTSDGPRWHYSAARFSDLQLFLDHKGKRVWEFTYPDGTIGYQYKVGETETYRLLNNRVFTPDEIVDLLKDEESSGK
jgi:hypothetical protein